MNSRNRMETVDKWRDRTGFTNSVIQPSVITEVSDLTVSKLPK
ncbi:hypothetical protein [Pantanalinema sp. GBBB05]